METNMAKIPLKTELELVNVNHKSTSTSVWFYRPRSSVAFMYGAKEGWDVILAITTLPCNEILPFWKTL